MKPKIIKKIKVVVCLKCKLIQDWKAVKMAGFCTSRNKKGKDNCKNNEFAEII